MSRNSTLPSYKSSFSSDDWISIQVHKDQLFQVHSQTGESRFLTLSTKTKSLPEMKEKIVILKPRKKRNAINPIMCITECLRYVFLTGGEGDHGSTVERYDLRKQDWQVMPRLNIARSQHASCTLGSQVFVFCGTAMINYEFKHETINSIERFDN